VSCGSCREQLLVQIDSEEVADGQVNDESSDAEENRYEAASELHGELVKKFQSLIVKGHSESCSWRRRGCDSSIQRIEGLLNMANAISTLHTRYNSILESDAKVPTPQSDQLSGIQEELGRFRFEENIDLNPNALSMALYGWHGKGEEVVECRHCFRSLGLWLYRGDEPTMERLDPGDSHLEYCPWRSPEAQETEIVVSGSNGEQKKQKLAGWELVYQAIAKDNAKKGRKATPAPEDVDTAALAASVTPEQREKKMKDLLKRLKDIRKPFSVKGLLTKKDKTQA